MLARALRLPCLPVRGAADDGPPVPPALLETMRALACRSARLRNDVILLCSPTAKKKACSALFRVVHERSLGQGTSRNRPAKFSEGPRGMPATRSFFETSAGNSRLIQVFPSGAAPPPALVPFTYEDFLQTQCR